MELWSETASAWTVEDFLRRAQRRMATHQEVNEDLTADQRQALGAEADRLAAPIAELRAGARALEDLEDIALLDAREVVFVRDQLVDDAQDEAWKIVGRREPILASAGQTRAKVFDTTRIGEIKRASREVTVATATQVAGNLRALPALTSGTASPTGSRRGARPWAAP
jgi:hypothetical protein